MKYESKLKLSTDNIKIAKVLNLIYTALFAGIIFLIKKYFV